MLVILAGDTTGDAACARCRHPIDLSRPFVRADTQSLHLECAAETYGRPAVDQALTSAWSRRTSRHFDR